MEKNLPDEWEWKRLGDVATYINGRAFKPTEWTDNGKPIIRIQNLTDESNSFNYFNGECESRYCIKNGDILISWSASLGIFVWNRGDAFLNQHIFKAILNEKIIDRHFFVFVIRTILKGMKRKTHGSTMKHIVKSEFNNIQIPIPPLETQRKIVAILEKAEETKRLRMQADGLTSQLLQSVFFDMFGDPVKNPKGWEVKTLGDICTLIKDGPHVSPNYVEEGVPFITVHNIIKGFFDLCNVKYISKEDHTKFCNRCKPEKGDILYSKGGTTGFAKRVDVDFEFSIWVHLALLKFPKDRLNPIFLETCLNSNYCKVQAKRYTRGIANRDLVLSQMAKIKIIVPPLSIQQKFAQIVEKVEAMRQNQKQSQQEIDNLFNVLMQKAFKGELAAWTKSNKQRR